jgi:hypothetical protein
MNNLKLTKKIKNSGSFADRSMPFISVPWVFTILSENALHSSDRNVLKAMRKSPVV